jgi:predicted transcriptional regulator
MAVSAIDISKSLSGIDFPANKQALVKHARGKHANQEVIDILESMPEQEYNNMADVEHAFGEVK